MPGGFRVDPAHPRRRQIPARHHRRARYLVATETNLYRAAPLGEAEDGYLHGSMAPEKEDRCPQKQCGALETRYVVSQDWA